MKREIGGRDESAVTVRNISFNKGRRPIVNVPVRHFLQQKTQAYNY